MNVAEEIRNCNYLLIQFEELIKESEAELEEFQEISMVGLVNSFRVEFNLYRRKEIFLHNKNWSKEIIHRLRVLKTTLLSKKNLRELSNPAKIDSPHNNFNTVLLGFNNVHTEQIAKKLLDILCLDKEIKPTFLFRNKPDLNDKFASILNSNYDLELQNKSKYLKPKVIEFFRKLESKINSNKNLFKFKGIVYIINEQIIARLEELIIFNLLVIKYLDNSQIRVVASLDVAHWMNRTIINYCNKFGINSVALQQGLASKEYPEFFDLRVNKICYGGISAKDGLIYAEYPATNCVETGLINQSNIIINETAVARDNNKKVKNILVIGQYFNSDTFSSRYEKTYMFMDVMKGFSNERSFKVLYKPHPFENDLLIKFLSLFCRFNVLDKALKIEDAIDKCDIIVVCTSTSIIEAIKQGKEIVLLSYKDVLKHQHFANSSLGKSNNIKKSRDISMIVKDLKANKNSSKFTLNNYQDFLEEFFGPMDGKNEIKIREVIKDQLLS